MRSEEGQADLLAEVVQKFGDHMLLQRLAGLQLRSHLLGRQQRHDARAVLVSDRSVRLRQSSPCHCLL